MGNVLSPFWHGKLVMVGKVGGASPPLATGDILLHKDSLLMRIGGAGYLSYGVGGFHLWRGTNVDLAAPCLGI